MEIAIPQFPRFSPSPRPFFPRVEVLKPPSPPLQTASLLAENGNPVLPPSLPGGFPRPCYLVYYGPLGFRRLSSVNTPISRPPRSVYVPLRFLFITTENPL